MSAFDAAAEKVRHTDPLLRITKVLLYGLMILAGLVVFGMVVAIPGLWLVPNHIIIDETTITAGAFPAITVILGLILIGAVLAILFLRQIIAIVDSVRIGSPFIPENARRLRKAAWLVLAMEGLAVVAGSIGAWIHTVMPKADARIDIDFSFSWLLTALLLFILARVFDQGTRLAEDVEGTV